MLILLNSDLSESQEIHKVTAYSHGCTKNKHNPREIPQKAANGEWPEYNITVAADWKLYPPGTEVIIEGIGMWKVTDTGGRIKGKKIDLFVRGCKFAKSWGVKYLKVWKVPTKSTEWSKNGY